MKQRTFESRVSGAGLGLRRELFSPLADSVPSSIDFMEVAPENWVRSGGKAYRQFQFFAERYPMVFHGLSLSIGGPEPLNMELLKDVKQAMKQYGICYYSEHLSYCSDHGQLYDLLPIPFTEESADHVVERIRQVQDFLGERIAMENVSFYANPNSEMDEIEFINKVINDADCLLHIDINNIYVNSVNHGFDAVEFLQKMPGERIAYAHIAGHDQIADDLIIDTHGDKVIPTVWDLLDVAYDEFGVFPTLLERDFNFPPLNELLLEVNQIREHQEKYAQQETENE